MKRLMSVSVLALFFWGCGASHNFTKQKFTNLKKVIPVYEDAQNRDDLFADSRHSQSDDDQDVSDKTILSAGNEDCENRAETVNEQSDVDFIEYSTKGATFIEPLAPEMKELLKDERTREKDVTNSEISETEEVEPEKDEKLKQVGETYFWPSFGLLLASMVWFYILLYIGFSSVSLGVIVLASILLGITGLAFFGSIVLLILALMIKKRRLVKSPPLNEVREEDLLHNEYRQLGQKLIVPGILLALTAFLFNPLSGVGVLLLIIGMILLLLGFGKERKYQKANDPSYTKKDANKSIALQIFGAIAAFFASLIALFVWAYFGMGA